MNAILQKLLIAALLQAALRPLRALGRFIFKMVFLGVVIVALWFCVKGGL